MSLAGHDCRHSESPMAVDNDRYLPRDWYLPLNYTQNHWSFCTLTMSYTFNAGDPRERSMLSLILPCAAGKLSLCATASSTRTTNVILPSSFAARRNLSTEWSLFRGMLHSIWLPFNLISCRLCDSLCKMLRPRQSLAIRVKYGIAITSLN